MDDIGNILYFLLVLGGLIVGFFQNRKKEREQRPVAPAHEWQQDEVQSDHGHSGRTTKPLANTVQSVAARGTAKKRPAPSMGKRTSRASKPLEVLDLDGPSEAVNPLNIDFKDMDWRQAIILSEILNRKTHGSN